VGLNGFNQTDESYSYDVTVSYETVGGISDSVKGIVSLGVKPDSSEDDGSGEDSNPSETVSISVRNSGDNVSSGSSVSPGDSVKITGEFNSSGSGLDSGWLATNETGVWENKTGNYKNDLSAEGEWVWNNFTWSNSSVSSQTVGWRLYANNSDGKVENSSKKTFDVGSGVSAPSVEVLEPVGVNGSNATLRGNVTSLGGASSVDVSFNVTSNSSIGVKDAGTVSSAGVFTYDLTIVEPATEYNYTAIAENQAELNESDKHEFITKDGISSNYDFEDGSKQGWTFDTNDMAVRTSPAKGDYAIGIDNDQYEDELAHIIPDGLNNGGQPDYIAFSYQESSYHQTGAGLRILDSQGREILIVGTNNPQWEIYDSNGWEEVYSGDGYNEWYSVNITFNWSSNEADIGWNSSSGTNKNFNDRPLRHNSDVEKLVIDADEGSWGDNYGVDFHVDDVSVD
jgi:hypothetical protein